MRKNKEEADCAGAILKAYTEGIATRYKEIYECSDRLNLNNKNGSKVRHYPTIHTYMKCNVRAVYVFVQSHE